jgi:hypothetical protein
MCPMCLMTAALAVAGVTSAGGLTTLVSGLLSPTVERLLL